MTALTALDSAFLRMEDADTALHIASIAVLDGPPPPYDQVIELITAKLPELRRFRQVVHEAPLLLGRPKWVDADDFEVTAHVHRIALPSPGDEALLRETVERLVSTPLDRSLPLWEIWMVEGLDGGRWALVIKVHHCIVDGVGGAGLLELVLGPWRSPSEVVDPVTRPAAVGGSHPAVPRPPRSRLSRIWAEAAAARTVTRGLIRFAELAFPHAPSSLAGPIGRDRSWSSLRVPMTDIREMAAAMGCTVNDVVLAAVTRGFRDLLCVRGEPAFPNTVRTLVPVSTRTADQRARMTNRITMVVANLPVHLADPAARLRAVHQQTSRLKRSGEPESGTVVGQLANLLPGPVVSLGLAGLFRIPQWMLVNVTTNVPGPDVPLYALGRRLRELYPYVPIADRIRIAVAVMSYDGALSFGVTADRSSTPDLDVFVDGIRAGLAELRECAELQPTPQRQPVPKPT
jgi:WS/DGAT/MGAT family acyltransferase